MKVCKFGGTSLADEQSIEKVISIVRSDRERRYVVVSAPGKIGAKGKITDALFTLVKARKERECLLYETTFAEIVLRFLKLAFFTGFPVTFLRKLRLTEEKMKTAPKDYVVSRGEYFSALLLSRALKMPFFDPSEAVVIGKKGKVKKKSYALLKRKLPFRAVIAGFYGKNERGEIQTFPRGGSDVSGAVIARAVGADEYENWTDVSGLKEVCPTLCPSKTVEKISYREFFRVARAGACVLQRDALAPVKKARIEIKIKNTFSPSDSGTTVGREKAIGRLYGLYFEKEKQRLILFGIFGKKEKKKLSDALGKDERVRLITKKKITVWIGKKDPRATAQKIYTALCG